MTQGEVYDSAVTKTSVCSLTVSEGWDSACIFCVFSVFSTRDLFPASVSGFCCFSRTAKKPVVATFVRRGKFLVSVDPTEIAAFSAIPVRLLVSWY